MEGTGLRLVGWVVQIAVWSEPVGGSELNLPLTHSARLRFWKGRSIPPFLWVGVGLCPVMLPGVLKEGNRNYPKVGVIEE